MTTDSVILHESPIDTSWRATVKRTVLVAFTGALVGAFVVPYVERFTGATSEQASTVVAVPLMIAYGLIVLVSRINAKLSRPAEAVPTASHGGFSVSGVAVLPLAIATVLTLLAGFAAIVSGLTLFAYKYLGDELGWASRFTEKFLIYAGMTCALSLGVVFSYALALIAWNHRERVTRELWQVLALVDVHSKRAA